MRVFLAVDLLQEKREKLFDIQKKLRKSCRIEGNVRWLSSKDFHITIVFVGDVGEERFECLNNAISAAAAGLEAFTIYFSEVQCYPNSKNPRVIIFKAKQGVAKFSRLQQVVSASLCKAGIEYTSLKPPHITLARVKSGSVSISRDFGVEAFSVDVASIALKRSRLLPKGAEYSTLSRFSFGSS